MQHPQLQVHDLVTAWQVLLLERLGSCSYLSRWLLNLRGRWIFSQVFKSGNWFRFKLAHEWDINPSRCLSLKIIEALCCRRAELRGSEQPASTVDLNIWNLIWQIWMPFWITSSISSGVCSLIDNQVSCIAEIFVVPSQIISPRRARFSTLSKSAIVSATLVLVR